MSDTTTKYQRLTEMRREMAQRYEDDKKACEDFAKRFYLGFLEYLGCSKKEIWLFNSTELFDEEDVLDSAYQYHMSLASNGWWYLPLSVRLGNKTFTVAPCLKKLPGNTDSFAFRIGDSPDDKAPPTIDTDDLTPAYKEVYGYLQGIARDSYFNLIEKGDASRAPLFL